MIDLADLSFVAMRDGKSLPKPVGREFPRCFWNVPRSGNFTADCTQGHRLALEFLTFEQSRERTSNRTPSILASMVGDMPRRLTGVEIGFFDLLNYALPGDVDRVLQVNDAWARASEIRKAER